MIFAFTSYGALAQERKRKVVFIIADGIPADVIEKVPTPNIDKIISEGSYLPTFVGGEKGLYNETPTISAVSYNSILTGTWVNKHNVWGNDIVAPNYNYWNIFRLYKQQHPSGKTAIFSSWQDNRTKLIGEGLKTAGNLKLDCHFDGYELDTVNFPHDEKDDFMHLIDERVSKEAAKCIKEKSPDLSWVYLEYTDDMGHRYGDSPQFYAAVEKLDLQVARIYQAIKYREKNFNEDWLMILTTDHGRDEQTGKDHGGQSTRQKGGWMVMNKKGLNDYAKYFHASIADILPTIASFMRLNIDADRKREIDGTSLLGKLSVAALNVNRVQNNLSLTWQSFDDTSAVKIWLAVTNNFKSGGKDNYVLVATVPAIKEHALIDISKYASNFYKIILEGKNNTVNRWWVVEEKP